MRYAAIDGGAVVSFREIADWDSYPAHKRDALDERGDGGPVLRPVVYEGSGPLSKTKIETDRVVVTLYGPPIEAARESAITSVDVAAEAERLKYVTGGVGQALTYREKYQQALLVLSSPATATEEEFPLVAASVGIEADTLLECADLIVERHAAWVEAGARIERVRLQAKRDINAATTWEQVNEIVVELDWG